MIGRVTKIKLESNLCYREKVLEFNDLLLCMLSAPAGADGIIVYHLERKGDRLDLEYRASGFRESLKDNDREDNNLVISPGTYYFEEYPDLSEEHILKDTMSELLGIIGKDEIYVRIFKKNALECVLQGFRPV